MDQDQDPKTIGALSQGLIGSMNGSSSLPVQSQRLAVKTDPVVAIERAKLMFGCFRKDDAADPETYSAAVAAILAEYAPEIVSRVTDPRSGLPSRSNWLPTVKEIREACDELEQRQKRFDDRRQQEHVQLAARAQEDQHRKRRPTLEELKAKHGENWGLKSVSRENSETKARREEVQRRANQIMFERECEAAGMPKDSPVSPSLASLIKAGMA